jgi:hypothetical protein
MRLKSVLKITVFSLLQFLFSCDPESHFDRPLSGENYLKIYNNTSDSIVIKKISYDYTYYNGIKRYEKSPEGRIKIEKGDFWIEQRGTGNLQETNKEKGLKYNNDKSDDSIIVYLGDKIVNWGGPMEYMGDSIHHFFNIDSWKQISNPENEGRIVLEFYITDNDFCN